MLFGSFSRSSRAEATLSRLANRGRHPLRLEMLEDRRLLSVTPYAVTSLADNTDLDGVVTLREAIEAANTNAIVGDAHAGSDSEMDVITFDSSLSGGTITLGGEELTVSDELEIQGPGAGLLTIDANNASRVLLADQGGELEISGLTIRNGKAPALDYGGGIDALSTTVSLSDVVVTGCEAVAGGGVYSDSPLTITDSTVSGNAANERDSSENAAGTGGGIYCSGTLNVFDTTIVENSSSRWGGGIRATGLVTLSDSTFSNNTAADFGGGVSCDQSSEFVISGSTFQRNAAGYGGGISNAGTGSVLSCTFVGNSSGYDDSWGRGGAINNGGDLEVVNSTIVGNRSPETGGGIANQETITLINCTVAANEALDGGGIWNRETLNLRNSILFRNAGGEIHENEFSEEEVFQSESSLIGVDPGFVRDPYEGDDGVWGTEDDDYGDLRLTDHSLAIDLGNTDLLPADIVDADGDGDVDEPIPFELGGDARVYGDSVDAGAYELQGEAAPGREMPSVVVTIDSDVIDPYDGEISLREAIHYSGLDGRGTVVTFDPSLDGATILLDGTPLFVNNALTIDASASGSVTIDAQGECTALERFGLPESGVTLIGLTITGGHGYQGGGIRNETGDLNIVDCTIERNTAGYGGGIYHEGGDISIVNSRLYANATVPIIDWKLNLGGALFLRGSGVSSLVNSILCGNTAELGGGIYNAYYGTVLNVDGCTFVGNHATRSGGVFASYPFILSNSVLYQNGGDNFWDGYAGSSNLLNIDPRFVRDPSPGADALWGTDDDDYGDLRLTDESPAIDFGDSGLLPADVFDLDSDGDVDEPVPVDLDGQPREYGVSTDCGAYEFQDASASGRETPSVVVTTSSDVADIYDGEVSLREAIFYAATSDIGTTVLFDPALNNQAILLDGEAIMISAAVTIDASPLDSLTIDGGGRSGIFDIYGEPDEHVEIAGLDITGGLGETGGGISNASTLTLRDCRLVENTSRSGSGAVRNTGTMEVIECELLYNRTAHGTENILYSGGAIRNSGVLTIADSVLAGNVADEGGAIYNQGTLTLINSTIVGNHASHEWGRGGAIDAAFGTYTLINTIITANSAYQGAGINDTNSWSGGGTLYNCIVTGNILLDQDEYGYGETGSAAGSNNLIGFGGERCELTDGVDGNLVGTAESPLDPHFVRNPSDGGDGWGDDPSTPDVDESANDDFGDLRLRPDSPAIDAGGNGWLPADAWDLDGDGNVEEPLPVDLAGEARIVGGTVDMGAYEYLAMPGDLNGDGTVGSGDLDIVRANWGSTVEPGSLLDGDPSGDGIVSSADLDVVRANWGPAIPVAAAVDAVLSEPALPSLGKVADAPYGPLRQSAFTSQRKPTVGRDVVATALQAWLAELEALDRGRDR